MTDAPDLELPRLAREEFVAALKTALPGDDDTRKEEEARQRARKTGSAVFNAAMMSRATAGVYGGKVVISTPGSPAAVRLAWEKLIAPELEHLAWEVAR